MSSQELAHDLLIVVCATSAGIHGALVREHFAEGVGTGVGFLAAAVLLSILVVALTRGEASTKMLGAAAAVLAGLIAGYALAATTGFPILRPDPEPVDGLALTTKVIEVVGLLAVLHVLRRGRPAVAPVPTRPEGTATCTQRVHTVQSH